MSSAALPGRRAGTVWSALQHRQFRIVWAGMFLSTLGTWMQNVVLGAFAYRLTHSATFVGVLYFAQLGPTLLLSNLGGHFADIFDRRRWLMWMHLEEFGASLALAAYVTTDNPSKAIIVVCVLAVGVGTALAGPARTAILPLLVPREDIGAVISLDSVQANLGRVIGPALGALVYQQVGEAAVFTSNAVSYLFVVLALVMVRTSQPRSGRAGRRFLTALGDGFRVARRDPLIRRVLLVLTMFSTFGLNVVGLMPVVAAENYGIALKSDTYGFLYAAFGAGAVIGAMSVGTVFASWAKAGIVRWGLAAFGLLELGFALASDRTWAFVFAPLLAAAYLVTVTSLSTILQEHVDEETRGRVMALWLMGFAGAAPVGVLLGGVVARATSIRVVLIVGTVVSIGMAFVADRRSLTADQPRTPELE